MSAKKCKITAEEYSLLRTLESLTGSLLRLDPKSLRDLTESWLWSAMKEQLKSLASHRAGLLQ